MLHPPKPVHSSDDEDDITFEELEDAVTQLDSTGAVNWNTLTARTREPRRSHSYYDVFFDADKEAGYETEEQQASSRPAREPIDSSQQTERSELRVPEWWVELQVLRPEQDRSVRSLSVQQHNPPWGSPVPGHGSSTSPDGNWLFPRSMADDSDNISRI